MFIISTIVARPLSAVIFYALRVNKKIKKNSYVNHEDTPLLVTPVGGQQQLGIKKKTSRLLCQHITSFIRERKS